MDITFIMKLTELIKQFPWANHPLVCSFAEFFSEEQWGDLTSAGMGELIRENKLSDKDLLKLLKDIHEVSNYPSVIESFKSGEHSFKELATFQIEEISQKHQPFGSEIQYLLANGFERKALDRLFDELNQDVAVEHVAVAAQVSAQREMGMEERKKALEEYWKLSLYPYNLFCKSKKLASEIITYLADELTFEQFQSTSNSKESALFKSSPSKVEFEKFKRESVALASFSNYCLQFVEAIELTDEADNGAKPVF